MASAVFRVGKGVWLCSASVAALVTGLACSESVHFRGFWPEFWIALSLGLVVTSLVWSVEARVAEEELSEKGQRM